MSIAPAALSRLVVLVALITFAAAAPATSSTDFPQGDLAIVTVTGARHDFRIELAVTPEQRAQGLMHRRSLAPDAGMLFVYARTREVAMWMKNTFVSLDMLFISAEGEVVRIAERTEPLSLTTIRSGSPVKGVLEVVAGTVARLGIRPGDRILHPAFGSTP
ncbi:MAG: DUF192 domain-containing protein [Kiloniellales bacterium]|nr:DUF192 domain-containing protein [Kiloniellales bacterium]